MSKITIMPENIIIEAKNGEILADVLWNNYINIRKDCGGKGICNSCSIKLFKDKNEKEEFILACKTEIKGNIIIELPIINLLEKMQILGINNKPFEPMTFQKFMNLNVHRGDEPY